MSRRILSFTVRRSLLLSVVPILSLAGCSDDTGTKPADQLAPHASHKSHSLR